MLLFVRGREKVIMKSGMPGCCPASRETLLEAVGFPCPPGNKYVFQCEKGIRNVQGRNCVISAFYIVKFLIICVSLKFGRDATPWFP